MGKNSSMIGTMFEEIKSLILSMDKKLDEKLGKKESSGENRQEVNPTSKQEPESIFNPFQTEQLIRVIAVHLKNADEKIGLVSDAVRESEKQVLSQTNEIKRSIDGLKLDSSVRHYQLIDLKSLKVVTAIIMLSVLFLASLFGNIHQFRKNSRMADNDLKYRYIRSNNGISPENLNKLEDIFRYPGDKKKIRKIREKVESEESITRKHR